MVLSIGTGIQTGTRFRRAGDKRAVSYTSGLRPCQLGTLSPEQLEPM
jgi:hypothetical protein